VDDVLSRVVEAFLALPVTLVALLALVVLGPSKTTVIAVVGILFAPIVARTVRAAVLSERDLDYVQAARLSGESGPYIMVRRSSRTSSGRSSSS
jgi:peptide/nickel transport system permease protein